MISGSLEENVAYMNSILPVKESFDLIQRDIIIGEKKCTFYFIDGFTKDETMQKLLSSFFMIKKDDIVLSLLFIFEKEIFFSRILYYIIFFIFENIYKAWVKDEVG